MNNKEQSDTHKSNDTHIEIEQMVHDNNAVIERKPDIMQDHFDDSTSVSLNEKKSDDNQALNEVVSDEQVNRTEMLHEHPSSENTFLKKYNNKISENNHQFKQADSILTKMLTLVFLPFIVATIANVIAPVIIEKFHPAGTGLVNIIDESTYIDKSTSSEINTPEKKDDSFGEFGTSTDGIDDSKSDIEIPSIQPSIEPKPVDSNIRKKGISDESIRWVYDGKDINPLFKTDKRIITGTFYYKNSNGINLKDFHIKVIKVADIDMNKLTAEMYYPGAASGEITPCIYLKAELLDEINDCCLESYTDGYGQRHEPDRINGIMMTSNRPYLDYSIEIMNSIDTGVYSLTLISTYQEQGGYHESEFPLETLYVINMTEDELYRELYGSVDLESREQDYLKSGIDEDLLIG